MELKDTPIMSERLNITRLAAITNGAGEAATRKQLARTIQTLQEQYHDTH